MSKHPFVLTSKNYLRPLKVVSEHAAVLPTYVGIVELQRTRAQHVHIL